MNHELKETNRINSVKSILKSHSFVCNYVAIHFYQVTKEVNKKIRYLFIYLYVWGFLESFFLNTEKLKSFALWDDSLLIIGRFIGYK